MKFLKKQIDYQEQILPIAPFINYERNIRNTLLLQLGYQNDLQRAICHVLCELINKQDSPLLRIDQSLIKKLEKKIISDKIFNINHELDQLIAKLQKDKLAVIFEDSSDKILIITGEQADKHHSIYNFYQVEKEYQKTDKNIAASLPKGNTVLSDKVIKIAEFFEKASTMEYDQPTIINVELKKGLYLYVPSNRIANFYQTIRLFIRNSLSFQNKEFPSFLALSLNLRLFELNNKLKNPNDEIFWTLFNKQYLVARNAFTDQNSKNHLSDDLQLAAFINKAYLQYRDQVEQTKNKNMNKVNEIVADLSATIVNNDLIISENKFDELFIGQAKLFFDHDKDIQKYLKQVKDNSLRNNLHNNSKYQLLFIGNHPTKSFVIHKDSIYPLFKNNLEKTSQFIQTNIYQILLNFLLESNCSLEALEQTPFFNLAKYREYIQKQINANNYFLSEILKKPQIIYQSLLNQDTKAKNEKTNKKSLVDFFFIKGTNNNFELMPIEKILQIELNTTLKNLYNSKKTDGSKLIPWWRRTYLLISGKKKFLFDEFYEISKSLSRNNQDTAENHLDQFKFEQDYLLNENNIGKKNHKSVKSVKSNPHNYQKNKLSRKIITTRKHQPQNLDEATAQFKKVLESYQKKEEKLEDINEENIIDTEQNLTIH